MRKMRKYLTNILIIIISIIIGLAMIEILLRIFIPQNLNISQIDEERVYKNTPNIKSVLKRQEFLTHIKINSQGLRDREYTFEKPANTERIRNGSVGKPGTKARINIIPAAIAIDLGWRVS